MSAVVHFVEKDAVPAELRCGLCRNPWWADNALTCPECDEIFCRTCIEDHLLKLPTCPKCSQAVRLDALRKPPRQLRSMSERNIKVHCPNARHCWQGPWGELSAHVAECPRNPAKYVYVGAADDDLVCEICHEPAMQPLAASCCEQIYCSRCIRLALSREERCPHCRAHQTEDVLAEPSRKIVSLLDALQVRCNAQCGWAGPRAELARHRDACPERVVVGGAAAAAAPRAGPVVVAAIPASPAATVADVAAPPAAPPAAPAGGDKPARHVAFAPAAATAAAAVAAPTTGSTHVTVAAKSYHPQLTASSRPVTCTTMAHLTAPQPTAAMSARRKDLHISAAMDISGSMRGDKLRLAKEALAFVVDELQPTDKFGLIAFDDQVEEVCPSLDMTAAGKQSALTHVRSLRDRGSTNLSGGLFAAVAQARDIAVTSARHTIAAAAGNCRSTRRAAQPHMGPATAAHADPAATAAAGGSWMSRSISRVASVFGSSSSSALPPASASYGSAAAPARVPPPAAVVPLPTYFDAFKLTLAVNASPMKQDGKWLARYSFEIDERLPAGVSSVSVGYGPVGNIVVRGRSTFPLIEDQEPVFTVQVFRDGLRGEPHAEFRFHVRADDEPRKHSFDVPAFAAPTAPTRDAARERSRIVLLFTDGQANAGITDPTTLVARTREVLASLPDKDVTIFTFGFGAGHNGTLLQQLAEVSQGSYYFVERADQIKEIFADCIGGLLSMVATNVRLVVRPAFGVRLRAVLTSFPQAANPDGSITVSIKDLYAEEQRDVLVEAEVAPRSLGPAAPVVSFALTCDNVVLGRAQAAEAVCALPTVAEEFTGTPDLDVDQQLSRHRAAEAMAEAQKFADLGEVAKANAAVRECRSQLAVAPSASAAYSQQLQRDLAVAERATSDAAVWRSEGQKQVSRMKSSHAMQRSNNVGDEADDMDTYSTAAKVASRRKARAS